MSHDQIGKTRMEFTDSHWVQMFFEETLLFLKYTVRPRDTRPQAARTLTVHDFELGPKILEKHVF